jgi:putative membrane protein
MMDWNDRIGWMNGNGMWMMLLVWGVLLALTVWAVVRMARHSPSVVTAEGPRQILDRRFASGELDAEQYGVARRVLEGRSVPDGPSKG